MTFARKLPFLAFLLALVVCFFVLFKLKRFGDLGPIVCIIGLAVLLVWGEVGAYPFEGRHKIRNQIPFFAAMVALSGIGNGSLNGPAPAWYPTDSPNWIIVPWLLAGVAMVLRGYRFLPKQVAATAASTPGQQTAGGSGGATVMPGAIQPTFGIGQRIGFFAFLGGLVIWCFFLAALGLIGEIGPLIITIGLISLFVFAEISRYPFSARQTIGHRIPFYASLILILGLAVGCLSGPAASWYPTDNPEWVILPVLLYLVASAMRGLRP
jgi:hypothetical protein